MGELRHQSIRAQIGDGCAAGGVAVRIVDIAAQFYVPCDQPPNSVQGQDPYALWLAPDRALQVGGPPPPGFVSDMSDALAVFELTGPRAGELLAMGCTLAVAPGSCGQTVFAGVRVLVYPFGEAIRIHAERQFAAFLLHWFQTAITAPA
jgi:sarcosine oxidase gamma subunit